MARGFLAGAAWGGILSALGVAVISVADDGPFLKQPEPVVDAPASAQGAPAAEAAVDPGVTPEAAPAAAAVTPAPDADAPDTLAALAEEARDPGTAPDAGGAGDAPQSPGTGAAGDAPGGDTAPARAAQPGSAPSAPGQDAPATAPAQPAGAGTEVDSAAPQLATPRIGDSTVGGVSGEQALPAATGQGDALTGTPEVPGAPEVATTPAPVTADAARPQASDVPSAQSAPGDLAAGSEAPLPAPRPALPGADAADTLPDADGTPADPPAPAVTALARPASDPSRPGIGRPAQSLASASSPRLPSVGGGAEAQQGDTAVAAPTGADARPVSLYAEPIEIAADRPLMSIVLIDDGTGPVGPEVLDGFPYPVTVAVDPTSDTALRRASDYRALGLEVLVLAAVPQGAQAQDVEVNLAARLSAVPEAVGVLETADTGLQGSRAVSDQVTAILSQTGHGLVLFPKGLNAAATQAAKTGVPAATVFRDFDGDGQDPKVMRRFLDQAAFKARQEDGVVMVGRLAPDTVSALLLWGLQDRAAQVGLVPVSMVLNASGG